ncbi:hypothetical protein M514_08336 [Trichuris suis]|uniref:Uncharacterized protein n=1 Tax=Trichuris suis TaxID=68888 RepID=A0A085N1Q5_9BILA|nr:hypothetical protein M513_08336 [Trichuris suis]KFD63401.1 hypothetical protein M514_08336 [Trichuris suis]
MIAVVFILQAELGTRLHCLVMPSSACCSDPPTHHYECHGSRTCGSVILQNHGTKLEELPKELKSRSCKWLFQKRTNAAGDIERCNLSRHQRLDRISYILKASSFLTTNRTGQTSRKSLEVQYLTIKLLRSFVVNPFFTLIHYPCFVPCSVLDSLEFLWPMVTRDSSFPIIEWEFYSIEV